MKDSRVTAAHPYPEIPKVPLPTGPHSRLDRAGGEQATIRAAASGLLLLGVPVNSALIHRAQRCSCVKPQEDPKTKFQYGGGLTWKSQLRLRSIQKRYGAEIKGI